MIHICRDEESEEGTITVAMAAPPPSRQTEQGLSFQLRSRAVPFLSRSRLYLELREEVALVFFRGRIVLRVKPIRKNVCVSVCAERVPERVTERVPADSITLLQAGTPPSWYQAQYRGGTVYTLTTVVPVS